jgi:SAM-dependent methyltransferase
VKFTTERIIPDRAECQPTLRTHMARYRFAGPYVQGAVVLDAGCGCGYGSHHLATAGAEQVVGVDVSPEAIEYARSHYDVRNLDFRVADVTALAFSDEAFDVVVCLEVFEHVADQQRLLAEVHRVLKPGGRFVVSTPNGQLFSPRGEPLNPWHVREFSRDEFEAELLSYFQDVQLWGQTVRTPGTLQFTLLHLRMQRYLATHNSWLSRALETGYRWVREACMAPARLAVSVVENDPVVIAEADDLPLQRTWYFIAVGCKVLTSDDGRNRSQTSRLV